MFSKIIPLDNESMIEISKRLINNQEKVVISLRGPKSNNEITVAAASLEEEHVDQLIIALQDSKTK